jgi:hypothetical protein
MSFIESKISKITDKTPLDPDMLDIPPEFEENEFNEVSIMILSVFEREWEYRKMNESFVTEEVEKEVKTKHIDFMNKYMLHLVSGTIRSNKNELIADFRYLIGENAFLENEARYIENLSVDVDFEAEDVECDTEEDRVLKIMMEKTLYPIFFKYTFHMVIKELFID